MQNGGLPKSMTSIAIREPGGPDMLVPREEPVPLPGEGEILVRVAAAGVNRPDVMQRQGHYPPPKGATEIPGLETAGDAASLGPGGTPRRTGAKAIAVSVAAGYAEDWLSSTRRGLRRAATIVRCEAAPTPERCFTSFPNFSPPSRLLAG